MKLNVCGWQLIWNWIYFWKWRLYEWLLGAVGALIVLSVCILHNSVNAFVAAFVWTIGKTGIKARKRIKDIDNPQNISGFIQMSDVQLQKQKRLVTVISAGGNVVERQAIKHSLEVSTWWPGVREGRHRSVIQVDLLINNLIDFFILVKETSDKMMWNLDHNFFK